MTYHNGMGTTPPSCVSQAQHDAAVTACKYQTVKGIGADVTGISPCVVKNIPICPPSVRMRFAPTYVPPTTDTNTPSEPEPEPEADEPNYMLWGGLGLLLVAAGGYVVYKTTKKNR